MTNILSEDSCFTTSLSLPNDFWDKARRARAKRAWWTARRRRGLGRRTMIPVFFHTCRTQSRARARRSPASQRRATSDSGGDSSGDPEPPRRLHYTYSPPAFEFGGAP